ncbi:MAG: hypothetical protein QOF73_1610, partial [Thermomicrobiales bacterium]|nr:hypothetical protein [Thermomicrobiales bacterium]
MSDTSRQPPPTESGVGFPGRLLRASTTVVTSVGAIVIALLIGAIFIVIFGDDPIAAYRAL